MIVGSVSIYVVKNYVSIEGAYFYDLQPNFFLVFIAIVLVSLVTPKPSVLTLELFDEPQRL